MSIPGEVKYPKHGVNVYIRPLGLRKANSKRRADNSTSQSIRNKKIIDLNSFRDDDVTQNVSSARETQLFMA